MDLPARRRRCSSSTGSRGTGSTTPVSESSEFSTNTEKGSPFKSFTYGVIVGEHIVETISNDPSRMNIKDNVPLGTVIKIFDSMFNTVEEYAVFKKFHEFQSVLGVVDIDDFGVHQMITVVGANLKNPQVVKSKHKRVIHTLVMANCVNLPFDYMADYVEEKVVLKRKGKSTLDPNVINMSDCVLVTSIADLTTQDTKSILTMCREYKKVTFQQAKLFIRDPFVAIAEMDEVEAFNTYMTLMIRNIKLLFVGETTCVMELTSLQFDELFGYDVQKKMRIGRSLNFNTNEYNHLMFEAVIVDYSEAKEGLHVLSLDVTVHTKQVFEFHTKRVKEGHSNAFTVSHAYTPSNAAVAIMNGFQDFYNGKHFQSYAGRSSNMSPPVDSGSFSDYFVDGKQLDVSQLEALNIAAFKPGFTLISAPPGSGKTMVIGGLCLAKFDINIENEKRMIITSSMNCAVTEAVFKVKSCSELRVCRKFSPKMEEHLNEMEKSVSTYVMAMHPDNRKYFNADGLRLLDKIKEVKRVLENKNLKSDVHAGCLMKYRGLLIDLATDFIDAYNPHVIGTTLFYILSKKIPLNATHLILDESSRISQIDALALYCTFPDLEFITIIGDCKQLPPYSGVEYKGLANHIAILSEMERMEALSTVNKCNLNYIYRTHPRLTDLLLRPIYGPQINSGIHVNDRSLAVRRRLPTAMDGTPCLFVQIGAQEEECSSAINVREITVVLNLLNILFMSDVDMDNVLIIVHHLDQRDLLISYMKGRGTYGPLKLVARVMTADSCQGVEADVVIVMTTKTCFSTLTSPKVLSFITEPHRETVAVSRAKEAIYILGDWKQLFKLRFWDKYGMAVRNRGALVNDEFRHITFD